jgi:KDO2-lipid IV(A) lauroyltransferase
MSDAPHGGRVAALRDRATIAGWSLAWSAVRRLPEPVATRAFRAMADLAWRQRGRGVQRLETNLSRVLGAEATPERVRELSRAGMRSYLRYWCEVFRLPDWSHERIVASFRAVDEHRLRDNLASGRGVVAALPHMGNWDLAGAWAAVTDAPVTTVAERLRPEELYQRFLAFRESLGMEILPLTGGDGDVFRLLADRLREGRLVPLLADRDLRSSGVEVCLFGAPTRMPPGPALLALQTGAALLPVTLWYDEHGVTLRFHEEVRPPATGTTREKVSAMTQAVADVFAEGIRAHPDDWHMLQRLWLDDLEPRPGRPTSAEA